MLYAFLSMLLVAGPLVASSSHTHKTEASVHKQVNADQLKSWYDQKVPMTVLDARSKAYFDGTLLPQAKWLPADSSEEAVIAAIPAKNALVVVYCLGVKCPASGWLYDKLTSMGYTNVYEYHEGLQDWQQRGYPTTKASG